MRKRISCRVIRSVPLGKGGDTLQSPTTPPIHGFRTAEATTYSRRLVIVRPCPNSDAGMRMLDLYA